MSSLKRPLRKQIARIHDGELLSESNDYLTYWVRIAHLIHLQVAYKRVTRSSLSERSIIVALVMNYATKSVKGVLTTNI